MHILQKGIAKERDKYRFCKLLSEIKVCERCFLCHSIVFCKTCNQFPNCCIRSICRGKTAQIFGNLESSGCWSESNKNPQGRLQSLLSDLAKLDISCYVNPHRNLYLLEALHHHMNKNPVELVKNQPSLGFFNQLFLVPKPNNCWRPILDLSNLNQFLKAEKFKMETPETIRTSLQQGEWVASINFKDAYLPIQEQFRKYTRFHIQGRSYQFKALPFGLSTTPMEFTVIAK